MTDAGDRAGADPERGVAVTRNVMIMDFVAAERIIGTILTEVDR